MGLIAVVYLAKENLRFDMAKEGAREDARTGAIYFAEPQKKRLFPRELRQAVRIKLGTSFEIADIDKELGPLLGSAESLLSERVLYDLSHSGDLIEIGELDRLEEELQSVGEKVGSGASRVVVRFLSDMGTLVRAAKEQKKPIVFV